MQADVLGRVRAVAQSGVRIGVAQITTEPGAPEVNLAMAERAIRQAAGDGAELVVLPELAVSGYTLDTQVLRESSEPFKGTTLDRWTELARETGTRIVGGFVERDDRSRLFNSVMGAGPEGPFLHYRKLHLFGAEKEAFVPGDLGLPVVSTTLGTIGVCVCYDLRFVEVLRTLSLRGAALVCVPSAWVGGFDARGENRAQGCPQADGVVLQANLCQVFVACASQAGATPNFRFLGSSLLVDPFGQVVVGPSSRDEQSVETAEVDIGDVERAQDRGHGIRPRLDRRTDVYTLQYGHESL